MAEDSYDLIVVLIHYLIKTKEDDGSILVFLPGAPEILFATEIIKKITKGMMIELLPFHGDLQPNEQNSVFRKLQAVSLLHYSLSLWGFFLQGHVDN